MKLTSINVALLKRDRNSVSALCINQPQNTASQQQQQGEQNICFLLVLWFRQDLSFVTDGGNLRKIV
ncbi:Hypothetical predicted protein [Cloeon dipterum]|uniref:Uncharacterized protein n=1 Tax=Cloeon dipterum TaxID=197152 RepID=A0A8S1C5I0_9INSE|nr:Hypothetical predicted protein [Cloeon dipterum]